MLELQRNISIEMLFSDGGSGGGKRKIATLDLLIIRV
jgi:hypothetical protein